MRRKAAHQGPLAETTDAVVPERKPHAAKPSPRSMQSAATVQAQQHVPPYRRHLAAREQELETFVESRIQQSIDDQRRDEALREAACLRQRDVERMKLHQSVKRRVELQVKSNQPVDEAVRRELGVELPSQSALTATAAHRRAIKDVPTIAFLESNADRLESAARHREACLEAERLKARSRVALEEYVGTDFAKKRHKLWQVAGRPEDSVRCPTAGELVKLSARYSKNEQVQRDEGAEIARAIAEVTALDSTIEAQERERAAARVATGERQPARKDLPFSLNATYKRGLVEA